MSPGAPTGPDNRAQEEVTSRQCRHEVVEGDKLHDDSMLGMLNND